MHKTAVLEVYRDVMHLTGAETLKVGDVVRVTRGDGPREGTAMGTATVTGFNRDGSPTLTVSFSGVGSSGL